MNLKRVVVTGIGALTPIGNNVAEYWENLLKGKSGASHITYFDTSKFKTKFACQLKDYTPSDHFTPKELSKLDRCAQYAMITGGDPSLRRNGVARRATMRWDWVTPSESDSRATLGILIYWGLLRGPPFGRLPQHTIQVHLKFWCGCPGCKMNLIQRFLAKSICSIRKNNQFCTK